MRRIRNYLIGLPESARTQREDPDVPAWGWNEELLAQLIEEVSVLAADKRRKEPRQVHRPFTPAPQEAGGVVTTSTGGAVAHGHEAMLAMFAGKVRPAPAAESSGEGAPGV